MPQVYLNFVQFDTPAETCQSIYFVQLCKKYLTIGSLLHYNRRRAFTTQKIMHNCHQKVLDNPGPCAYNTRVGTGSTEDLRAELFLPKVQKVLDTFAPVLYNWRARTEDLLNKK